MSFLRCRLPGLAREMGLIVRRKIFQDPRNFAFQSSIAVDGVKRFFSIMDRYRQAVGISPLTKKPPNLVPSAINSSAAENGLGQGRFSLTNYRKENRRIPYKPPNLFQTKEIPSNVLFPQWDVPSSKEGARSIKVALIGPPNAGKSSLLNAIIGKSISAVSSKVNTTRNEILGIHMIGDCQIVFIDAPGIIESHPGKKICRELVNLAWRGYEDADLAMLIIDVVKRPSKQIFDVVRRLSPKPSILEKSWGEQYSADTGSLDPSSTSLSDQEIKPSGFRQIPLLLCLNKTDLASHKKWILAREKEFRTHGDFKEIFHVSAKRKKGLTPLVEYLASRSEQRHWTYPTDMVTTLSKAEQVSELIRLYIFNWFNKDVPYKINYQLVGWGRDLEGNLVIEHEVLVGSEKVAKMLCGIRGRLLLQMKRNVVHKLWENWGESVTLHLHVKVVEN